MRPAELVVLGSPRIWRVASGDNFHLPYTPTDFSAWVDE